MSPTSTNATEPGPKPPEAVLIAPGATLDVVSDRQWTREELREWLDRKPPPKPDLREREEFEQAKVEPVATELHLAGDSTP